MAIQIRERLTITADGLRTHGDPYPRRKAKSLPRFLTSTPIIELKEKRRNSKRYDYNILI